MSAEVISLNREAAKRDRNPVEIVSNFAKRFSTDAHKARFTKALHNLIDEHAHLDADWITSELAAGMMRAQDNARRKE